MSSRFSVANMITIMALFGLAFGSIQAKAQNVDPHDLAGDSWILGTPMPTPRMGAFSGVIGSKIYVVGGENNSTVLSVNEVYDIETNKWATGKPMPTARWLGASAVVNGILYAMGGGLNNGGTNVVEAYNPKKNTWTEEPAMPSLGGNIYATVENGLIYVVGGFSNGESLGQMWSYNPVTQVWTQEASLLVAKRLSAVGLLNSTIIAAGGLASEVTNDNEGYHAKDEPVADFDFVANRYSRRVFRSNKSASVRSWR
jgi:N-acetylneuraminic acid mutarotase